MSTNGMIFNLAGVSVVAIVAGYIVNSTLTTERSSRCSQRYPAGSQFALDNENGQPLSPIEFQARTGQRQWGVLENSKIVKATDSPSSKVLEVKLAKIDPEDADQQNGVGFFWPVAGLEASGSACLSYSAYLPENLKITDPGHLPGLFGGSADDQFKLHMGWNQSGDIGVDVRSPFTGGSWYGSKRNALWARGQWVQIDQEIVLNAPGKDNGVLRVWVDGALRVENTSLKLREAIESGLEGVVADTGYTQTASDPVTVQLSPFVVQWK